MSETNDVEVTRGISLPSVWLLEIGAYPLGCRRLENGIILNFALPCFPPMVSGLGKQEIAFSFLLQKAVPLLQSYGGSQDGSSSQRLAHL